MNVIEPTPEMIAAGVEAVLDRLGGYDLGGHFSASQLATEVYRAMASERDAALLASVILPPANPPSPGSTLEAA